MNLNDLLNRVARKCDTKGTKINVAETRRVARVLLNELLDLPAEEFHGLMYRAAKRANRRL